MKKSMSKELFFFTALLAIQMAAWSAEWIYIGNTGNGARWYSTDTVKMGDGTIRTFLKGEGRNLNVAPFAILIDCKGSRVRDYVAGDFGTEFFKPWQPPTPETVGELAINFFCKKK